MIDVAVRLISAFLAHPEHGVNELAGSLPRQRLGNYPDDEAPPVVEIFNDVDDKGVAKNLIPPKVPSLIVFGDSSEDVPSRGYTIARDVIICIAFATADGADPGVANRTCGYLLRGARMTLWRFNDQAKSAGFRALNGIKVHEIKSVTEQRISDAQGPPKLWGLLLVNLTMVDTLS